MCGTVFAAFTSLNSETSRVDIFWKASERTCVGLALITAAFTKFCSDPTASKITGMTRPELRTGVLVRRRQRAANLCVEPRSHIVFEHQPQASTDAPEVQDVMDLLLDLGVPLTSKQQMELRYKAGVVCAGSHQVRLQKNVSMHPYRHTLYLLSLCR